MSKAVFFVPLPRWGGVVLATSKKTKDRELPLGPVFLVRNKIKKMLCDRRGLDCQRNKNVAVIYGLPASQPRVA